LLLISFCSSPPFLHIFCKYFSLHRCFIVICYQKPFPFP
jgi:hypothetical protein